MQENNKKEVKTYEEKLKEINERYKELTGTEFSQIEDSKKFKLFFADNGDIGYQELEKEDVINGLEHGFIEEDEYRRFYIENYIITDNNINVLYEEGKAPIKKKTVADNVICIEEQSDPHDDYLSPLGYLYIDTENQKVYENLHDYEVDKVTKDGEIKDAKHCISELEDVLESEKVSDINSVKEELADAVKSLEMLEKTDEQK